MRRDEETLFGPTQAELARLRDELRALGAARWQLVRLEAIAALADVKRLAVGLAVSALLALVSLPVLIVAAAEALSGSYGIDRTGWLLICFAVLIATAAGSGWMAWRRFRRHFVGLEESLEVLREDRAWIDGLKGREQPR